MIKVNLIMINIQIQHFKWLFLLFMALNYFHQTFHVSLLIKIQSGSENDDNDKRNCKEMIFICIMKQKEEKFCESKKKVLNLFSF